MTIDALDLLDEYKNVYDIDDYKARRNDALQYLVHEIKFHGYSYSYLEDIYRIITVSYTHLTLPTTSRV